MSAALRFKDTDFRFTREEILVMMDEFEEASGKPPVWEEFSCPVVKRLLCQGKGFERCEYKNASLYEHGANPMDAPRFEMMKHLFASRGEKLPVYCDGLIELFE